MSAQKKTRPYACTYHHDGADWDVTIQAYDMNDAEERARKLGRLRVDGEIVAIIPARAGIFAKVACALRNAFAGA